MNLYLKNPTEKGNKKKRLNIETLIYDLMWVYSSSNVIFKFTLNSDTFPSFTEALWS